MYIGVARRVQWVHVHPPSCWEFNYRTNVPYVLNFGALTTLRLHKDINK